MQIIGKTSEIKLAENLPSEVKADIVQTLYILDSAYGKDRNIIKDMGGFCCVIRNEEDVKFRTRPIIHHPFQTTLNRLN